MTTPRPAPRRTAKARKDRTMMDGYLAQVLKYCGVKRGEEGYKDIVK